MKTLRLLFATIILFATAPSLFSQELSDALPKDPAVRTGTLANGMKYYIRKNHKPENRVEFRLAVKTGSVMENDDQQGLAHFCEHMQFNGTEHFPKMDLVNFLESTGVRFGAHLNAYTSFDETVYMLQLPMDKADMLDKGMLVMQDWAGHATFEDVEIDKERGVVVEEWRLGRGANERIQNKQLPVELYNSRYAERIPIGKKEIIEKCSYQTLRNFYHDWYRPDLMAFMAVGDFNLDSMEMQIKKRFSTLQNPPNERPRTKYTVPLHDSTLITIAGDKELQFQIGQIIFERPKETETSVGDYRRSIVGRLYDGMLNARLQEIMQKGDAPFAFAGAGDGQFLGGLYAYTAFVALKPDQIQAGLKSILDEMYRVKQTGFTTTELEREKKDVLTKMEEQFNERDKTESSNYIQEYLRNYLSEEPYPGIEYEFGLYKKFVPGITIDEVNALTTKRMNSGSRVIAIGYQIKDSSTVAPTEKEILGIVDAASKHTLTAYNDKVSNKPLLSQMPTPGKVTAEESIADLGITKWTLSNGAHVIIKPTDFKNDQILFSAHCPGGTSLSGEADFISASFADNVVDMSGVSEFDETTLRKMLAGKNVTLGPTMSELQEGFSGKSTPQDIETMCQLLYLYATSPRKDPEAFQAFQGQMSSFLKNRDNDPQTAFRDTLQVTMAQYHPLEKPFTMETLNKIDIDKALSFYKDRFSDYSNFTFYFVGNVKPMELKPLVEKYVASLPAAGRKEMWKDLGVNPPKGTIMKSVYKGIEPKSSVTINITGPFQYNPKNRFDLQAMTEVLSIKLRETLREDMGGVYGVRVSSTPLHYPHERYQLSISFGCDPARVKELVDETMRKLDTMTMKAPDEIYVTKVKQIQKHEYEVNLKENSYWLGALSQLNFNGEDPHGILNRKNLIENLNAGDILKAGQQYCAKNNLVEVVLYPEKKTTKD
jgi:zinc protease